MKEAEVPDVPSFSALRKQQSQLIQDIKIKTQRHVTALGNKFYANSSVEAFKLISKNIQSVETEYSLSIKDFVNPFVRLNLHFYPEQKSSVSEFWQAQWLMNDINYKLLQPMWVDNKKAPHYHFYIWELVQLSNETFVLPLVWYVKNLQILADALKVHLNTKVRGQVISEFGLLS